MKFGTFYSETLGWMMKQVNKTTARKLYEQGRAIYLHPCNMRFDNPWQLPCCVGKEATDTEDFDTKVNRYIYYNCDRERGKYAHYFVKD